MILPGGCTRARRIHHLLSDERSPARRSSCGGLQLESERALAVQQEETASIRKGIDQEEESARESRHVLKALVARRHDLETSLSELRTAEERCRQEAHALRGMVATEQCTVASQAAEARAAAKVAEQSAAEVRILDSTVTALRVKAQVWRALTCWREIPTPAEQDEEWAHMLTSGERVAFVATTLEARDHLC